MEEKQQQQQLVFIPSPGVGHLVSMVELAKLLVHRYSTLSVSLLIITSPANGNLTSRYIESLSSDLTPQIKLVNLPHLDQPSSFLSIFESQKPRVTEAVSASLSNPTSPRLAGFVLDMFCASMLEVADEFSVPSYIFFTSGAAFLGFMFRIQSLHDEEGYDVTESEETELVIPSYSNPVPRKVFPSTVRKKEWVDVLYKLARDFRKTKGILVNTVKEVESYAIDSLSRGLNPNIYPVGPILNLKGDTSSPSSSSGGNDVIQWLDEQPESSVVFLCFGSMGAFGEEQVKEIASALEKSGLRFLWSLRRRSEKEAGWVSPTDYDDVSEVLPEGFLDRTADVGKVIGWAPQTAVLAHRAVGGFVSHCGWNSTLESIWFGVPMATWPMYAEQQINAFLVVKELGMGTEIKMDYRVESGDVVKAEEIERGIRSLMDKDCGLKKKVEELRGRIREAFADGGSSSSSIAQFIQDL